MKKTTLIAVIAIAFSFFVSSCSKCTTCTKNNSTGSGIRLCESDYSSNTAYGIAVDYYSNSGYNCN